MECFPTKIRTIGKLVLNLLTSNYLFSGIGTCSLLARTGALLAPQMAYLSDIYRPAPYAVVCSIGTISLLISCVFLPDTKGVDLAALDPTEELDYDRKKSMTENIVIQRKRTGTLAAARLSIVENNINA